MARLGKSDICLVYLSHPGAGAVLGCVGVFLGYMWSSCSHLTRGNIGGYLEQFEVAIRSLVAAPPYPPLSPRPELLYPQVICPPQRGEKIHTPNGWIA